MASRGAITAVTTWFRKSSHGQRSQAQVDASTVARALSEARRATAADQLHRNNCSVQPGDSMQASALPLPPFTPMPPLQPAPLTLQVTVAGRIARAELHPRSIQLLLPRLQMAVNLK
ncbi:unnamed protein product [Arctia plantaginis]|uniref:Uncharacterized protein n=1 Tax=Arctia plantaginis TaxID=874455 RepID=A0A8S1ALJ9_ARCPL|nr:unnamed protein product [Arctia plantaginis]CAB3248984.1 unnamed protein product [Arctia plantaginis]